ncbi:MAG TPA: amino acid adenylation domain-containing protein, partial [Methylomirabilota bacterium]|nr:amino acid adenylation domain-containing protein [Methylomirabilota bacterium]
MATDTAQQISPIEDVYPLSALQENMVSCSQSTAKPGQDVEQVVGDLVEAIEVEAFACAWEKIVQRHAVLRSGFAWAELPRPHQEVRRRITVPLKQIDWRGLPGSEQDQAFGEWLKADRLQGFDLSEPPLVRANLFRFGEARFRFVWTFHHALLDATSFALVLEELFALYEAARKRQELDLPAPPAYRQFVDEMGSGQRVEAEAFWKQLLAGYEGPPRMGNSVEFPELSPTAALCREQTLELSRAKTDALRAAAQRHQVTISTLLYAAWGLLLGRYGSVEDVVFGTVQAGRRGPGQRAEKVVGLLINTLPLRVRTPADKPVSEWLREIRSQQSAARAFERTPLLNIIECSSIRKGSPLFETIVNFQEPAWHDRLSCLGGGWSGRRFRVYNQPGYPLWLDAWAGEVLTLRIGYEQQRFDEASISRMLNHLEVILGSLASADFSGKVEELEIMSEVEKRQVVCEWNRTAAVFPEQGCVQDLVARQAAQSPNTVAASSAERQLTYGELNCVANQLGHFLQSLGAGPEQRVAVCMDRSLEMVVAELAILKAGAAYVPLDPSYPEERLKFMIEDSGALAVLTQGTGNEIQAGAGCGVFAIDLERPGDWKDLPDTNPNHQGGPSSLAYLIYTSGSSGRPKGVAVEQGGLLNLIGWHQREYEITSQDRATLLAGPAFDASVWELWPYLAAGASLHIPDDETRLCPAHLLEWLTAQKISLAFLPTPMAEAMLLEDWTPNKTLRAVLAGGESLHRRPGSAFGRALINHYGPTECTVVATAGRVGHDPEAKQAPSIGRPIANIRAYCLDPRLRPLPIGVAGELHLSGAGLARGYWNQPAFSAERFIPNPFGEPGYQRLYKTGDLARWLPDGNLEFVGRLDQQIKIRGQRVELGEIESVLREHPAVKEAVVKADANNAGLRLAAYIVKAEGSSLEAPELKAYLAAKLPLAMRPETLTFLPALPITPNGKVDRAMLQPGDLSPDPGFIAPRNQVEEMVAGAWSEVLDRTPIGVNDNFFELGGHSLQATQVMSRLRNIFQASLPLHYLFDAPTVASLAEKVVAARQQHQVIPVPPQSGRRGEALTASFNQERMWFLEQLEPGLALHNIPFAIQLKGTLDVTALERGLTEILARHQPLRTVFSSVDGRLLLRETPPGSAPLPLVDLSAMEPRERESEAQRIVLENARVPFDLSQGPLFRACLVRLGRQEHLLLLTMHLIASDAWSVGVLYKELAALYEAFSSGRPSPLPPLPISYSDFARWQRQSLRGETLEAQLAYWKAQWPDGDPGISLPTDFPRPEVQTFNGATRFFALPASLAQSLKAISRREDVTLYMLSLAAFKALMRQYSGNDLIAVGSPIAGRTFRNTEDLIGSFVNT